MTNLILIFYGDDPAPAKQLAANARKQKRPANVRHALAFDGKAEKCAEVVLMPDVSDFDGARIEAAYGNAVKNARGAPTQRETASGGSEHAPTQEARSAATDGGNSMNDLRAEYERVIGRKPYMGWKADMLRQKIAEAQGE